MGHAYRFRGPESLELLKALGLEGRKIKRIELVFDVDQAVTATITEYSLIEHHAKLCRVLTALGPWVQDVTSADDEIRQYANA